MLYPNSALSAWQLAVIAIVAVVTLAAWLAAVFIAAREPARRDLAAAGTAAAEGAGAVEGTGAAPALTAGQPGPAQQPAERKAA